MNSCRLFSVLAFCLMSSFSTTQIKAQSGEANLFLPGATLDQAEPALDATLQNLLDANHVELIRKIKQPDQKFPENLTKVTIQLESKCNFDQLIGLLDAIKSHEEFLRVEELSIATFRLQGKLEIRPSLTVAGFVENAPDEVRAHTQNLEKRADGARALLFRRDQNLEILEELTGLLPPDAVLMNYHNRDCTIQFSGLLPPLSSSDLMEKLNKSPFLKDVTYTGRIYSDPQTGRERVSFSAKCAK